MTERKKKIKREIKMVLFSPEKIGNASSDEYVTFASNDMITNSNNISLSSVYHVPSRYFMAILPFNHYNNCMK